MAYTAKQLTMAWAAVHNGVAPNAEALSQLQLRTSTSFSDQDALGFVINSADSTTALAVLSYQFFTGKSPTKAGMDYLVNSPTNPNDLNDPYYTRFSLENRYINFAANLGVVGEGAAAFSAKYGTMSFAAYVASIYETIIGASYAKAAGLDAAKAIADISSRQAAILATAKSAGMITPNMTQAQIDLAVKAATAGYLLGEAIKADVGLYAAAANNFMLAVAKGEAVYNVNITTTYKPVAGSGSQGTGRTVDVAPAATALPGGPPPPPPEPPPSTAIYRTLTAGPDTFNGDDDNDIFTASHTSFDASDVLNGKDGLDTLTLVGTKGSTWIVPNATVTNFEIANISNDAGLSVDTSTWTGLNTLKTTSVGVTTVTAATTTDVVTKVTGQGAGTVTALGGHNVNVTTTGATTGQISIGAANNPTGAIVVNREATGPVSAGTINVHGGTSVDITQTATTPVNTTQTLGSIVVTGGPLTTAVKIKNSPAATADATHAGVVSNFVLISDVNDGTNAVGVLTTVDVDGATNVTVRSHGLTTLAVKNATGDIFVQNASPYVAPATTLNLTLNNANGGGFKDNNIYTTLNITTAGAASSLTDIIDTALTTLKVGGTSALTLTSVASAPNLQTVTTTGAGGLNADLSGLASLTSVNTTASTGASTLTIDASKTSFTGGAGGDTVTLSGTNITKAINLGAGNDTLVLATGTGTPGVMLDGGAGTADVLQMNYQDAINASGSGAFAAQTTGFERLAFVNGPVTPVDVTLLGNYNYFIAQATFGLTLVGLKGGDTLEFQGFGTAARVDATNFGANDVLNIVATRPVSGSLGALQSTGIKHIAVAINDFDPTLGAYSWRANSTGLETIVVTGVGALSVRSDSAALTSADGSAVVGHFGLVVAANLAQALTIKGSVTGSNDIYFVNASGGAITYEGGSGDDTIDGRNGRPDNVIHLGEGNNHFLGDGGGTTAITAGSGDDWIAVGTGGATVNAGDGDNMVSTLDNTASTITAGSGNDNIFVGGGANVVNVGSGTDFVGVSAATATATDYTTINGMGAGDKIEFSNLSFVQTTAGAAVATQGSYLATLTLALAGDGSAASILKWFKFGGDTYVVVDNSVSASFDPGVDYVVKVTGDHNLNVAGNVSTFDVTLH